MTDQPPFDADPSPDYSAAPPPPPPAYSGVVGEQPLSQSDERLWAMLAHLSELVFAIVAPLLIMVILGKRSAFVEDQAKEALNFQITLLIATFVAALSLFVLVGIVLLPLVIIGGVVFAIMAAIKSYGGELYRYPLTIRFVK